MYYTRPHCNFLNYSIVCYISVYYTIYINYIILYKTILCFLLDTILHTILHHIVLYLGPTRGQSRGFSGKDTQGPLGGTGVCVKQRLRVVGCGCSGLEGCGCRVCPKAAPIEPPPGVPQVPQEGLVGPACNGGLRDPFNGWGSSPLILKGSPGPQPGRPGVFRHVWEFLKREPYKTY